MSDFSPESLIRFDMFIQAVKSVAGHRGIVYVTVPITTGKSHFILMNELGCSSDEVRANFSERWRTEVFDRNMNAAESWAEQARNSFPKRVVLDPSRLFIRDWGQPEYYELWQRVIVDFADVVVATPDWAFSNGARAEVDMAFKAKRRVVDLNGIEYSREDIVEYDQLAKELLRSWGWSEEKINASLNAMDLASQTEHPPTGIVNWARNEALSWVHGDLNSYEVEQRRDLGRSYYTPDSDDLRTQKGLIGPDTWHEKVYGYWNRMLEKGIASNGGQLELGSMLGASIAMLRSVWRIHGALASHSEMELLNWKRAYARSSRPQDFDYSSELQLSEVKSSVWSWIQTEYTMTRKDFSESRDRQHTQELEQGNSRAWHADIWDLHWKEVQRLGFESQEGKYQLGKFVVCIFRLFESVVAEFGSPPRREWRDHSRLIENLDF